MRTALPSLFLALLALSPAPDDLVARYAEAAKKWEPDIAALEARDAEETHPDDSILFLGSSSIRLWETLAADMAPFPVIRRGYGGARFTDLAVFAERLVRPHAFRAAVVFVANDITGRDDDLTPEEVAALFRHVVGTLRKKNPDAPVFLIAVTPTPARWKVWTEIRAANAALREACEADERLHFIATESHFLGEDGLPKRELFRDDQLHLAADGYALWTRIVRGRLVEVLGEPAAPEGG